VKIFCLPERDGVCAHGKHGNNMHEIDFSVKVLREVRCGLEYGVAG
jgi:hypothetical protein